MGEAVRVEREAKSRIPSGPQSILSEIAGERTPTYPIDTSPSNAPKLTADHDEKDRHARKSAMACQARGNYEVNLTSTFYTFMILPTLRETFQVIDNTPESLMA